METTLKREKFAAQAEVKLPDLFLEAKTKLGYEPSAISEADRRETRRKQELEVAAALDSLGIEPLSRWLDGRPCYYDGSTLNAEPVFEVLLREGSAGVWRELRKYYDETFGSVKS